MRRDIFSEEHEMFRTQVRRFVENELVPKIESWNRNGMSDRESWRKMGEAGFLGANAPAEYGGAGADFLYDAIVVEELSRVRAHGLMMGLHSDIIMPYIATYGTDDQKRRYPDAGDQRRDHPGDCDDRAGHRFRPRGGPDHRPPRW